MSQVVRLQRVRILAISFKLTTLKTGSCTQTFSLFWGSNLTVSSTPSSTALWLSRQPQRMEPNPEVSWPLSSDEETSGRHHALHLPAWFPASPAHPPTRTQAGRVWKRKRRGSLQTAATTTVATQISNMKYFFFFNDLMASSLVFVRWCIQTF